VASRNRLPWQKRSRRPREGLRRSIKALLGTGFLAALSSPAVSQVVTAPQADSATLRARLAPQMALPGRPMPADAGDLDAMLQRKDFGRLAERLRAARQAQAIQLDLNWEQTKLYDGAGFLIAYAYMHDLWRLGFALPSSSGEGLKQAAGMMFLYSLALVELDGPKCADATAPGHRADQLISQNQPILAYVRTLPRTTRMQMGTIALGIEAATGPVRKNDEVLCGDGLTAISEGLKSNGSKPLQQLPNAPGTIGKTYAVPPAPGYRPQFVGEDVWRPKQAAARQSLPATLTKLLTLPGDTQPTPSAN